MVLHYVYLFRLSIRSSENAKFREELGVFLIDSKCEPTNARYLHIPTIFLRTCVRYLCFSPSLNLDSSDDSSLRSSPDLPFRAEKSGLTPESHYNGHGVYASISF